MLVAPSTLNRHNKAAWFGVIALAVVAALCLSVASRPSALTRAAIHLALVEYALALWQMIGMNCDDWRVRTSRGQVTRWLWTWACVTFLVHVACAFHFTHRWSHAHAFEQTRIESGYGEGLYVNYLFVLIWMSDVAWWWFSPDRYARRPRWIDRLLHGFMLFIALNATVVFEPGAIRYAGAIGALFLATRWLRSRRPSQITESAAAR